MRTSGLSGLVCLLAVGCGAAPGVVGAKPAATGGTAAHANSGAAKPGAQLASDPGKPGVAGGSEGKPEPSEIAARGDKPWIGASTRSQRVLVTEREQAVAVWVDVPVTEHPHVPVDVALAVDTSGSMHGTKISQARRSAIEVVRGLADGDVVSVTTFASSTQILVQPMQLDQWTRPRIEQAIDGIVADGDTNLYGGVSTATQLASNAPSTHSVRRVILISDGKATTGPTSPGDLAALGEFGLQRGVQMTSMGVGLDYDESTLNALAIRSAGRLYHIAEAGALSGVVRDEINLLQRVAATDASVEIQPAPGVRITGIEGVRATSSGNAWSVPLGAMYGGQSRELVVRVSLPDSARAGEARSLLSARLHFGDPANDGVARVEETVVRALITDNPSEVAEYGVPRAESILATRTAAELAQAATAQVNAGNLAAAEAQLAQAEGALRREAQRSRDEQEQRRLTARADTMARAKRAVGVAAAAPPAAKPSAARGSALDANSAAMKMDGY